MEEDIIYQFVQNLKRRKHFLQHQANPIVSQRVSIITSFSPVNTTPLGNHEGVGRRVTKSKDGQTAVSGSGDDTVRLWDVERGTLIDEHRFAHKGTDS